MNIVKEKYKTFYINLVNGKYEPFKGELNHDSPKENIDFNFTSTLLSTHMIRKEQILNLCNYYNIKYNIIRYGREYDIVFYNYDAIDTLCNFLNDTIIFTHGENTINNYSTITLLNLITERMKQNENK